VLLGGPWLFREIDITVAVVRGTMIPARRRAGKMAW
jgi:hypothetical protein